MLNKKNNSNQLYFDEKGIISEKLTCLQYLLYKYGLTKKKWEKNNIETNWIGFDYIDTFFKKINFNN